MRSFWFDPYLWVHLAGIAAVPLFLGLCVLGLAVGTPLFPAWFELLFVGAIGILPILWMQWRRPFSIFSLVLLALKPAQLTEEQRRILQRFRTPLNRILAVLSAVAMAAVLWQLYQIAPSVTPALFPGIGRGLALLAAAIAFLGSNLFLQVPVSVVSVLLTDETTFATTPPYPLERIAEDFTIPGIQVGKILPPLLHSPPPAPPVAPPSAASSNQPPATVPAPVPESPLPVPEMPEAEANNDFNEEVQDDEAALLEEVEIAERLAEEKLAESEPATANPSESQIRDVTATTDLENELIEATQPPPSSWESTQLEESSDVTEEISISAPPPPPETAAELREFPAGITPERSEAITAPEPAQEATPPTIAANPIDPIDATDSVESTVSPTPPTDIVEDTTIAETLDNPDPAINPDNAPDSNQREPQQETQPDSEQ